MPAAAVMRAAAAVRRHRGRALSLCFVAPYAWPVLAGDASHGIVGGAEVQQCILARVLARQGVRVSMVTLDFAQDALA